jgi:hypothetical protein
MKVGNARAGFSDNEVVSNNGPARQQPLRSGVVHAAATIWLIIGAVVLAGFAVSIAIFVGSASSTAPSAEPTPYQLGRPQREDAFWAAYQASPSIVTKMSRTNAISLADQMCAQEGSNPGGIMSYAQSRHSDDAALQETAEMLRLADSLCA